MLTFPLFHEMKETVPTVTIEPTCIRVFGEPHEDSFPNEVAFRHESKLAGIVSVDGIVGNHPIVIIRE